MIAAGSVCRGQVGRRILAAGAVIALAAPPALAGGGHKAGPGGHWGEYGLGPHVARPHHSGRADFGYPYFTHPMTCPTPYPGYAGGVSSGYPYFGPYTGAPVPPPIVWPMTSEPRPAARPRSVPRLDPGGDVFPMPAEDGRPGSAENRD